MLLLMKGKPHLSGWNLNLRDWNPPQFSVQRKFKNLSFLKIFIHLKDLSCSILVRKHALSELRPLTDTNVALYHMGVNITDFKAG